jgi:Rieske Fe-S protein
VPVLRFVIDPASNLTVTTPTEPIDIGELDHFKVGGDPRKVEVVAPIVKDAWIASRNVVLGAAFIRRTAPDKIEALSSVCPHLGCAVGWDDANKNYLCPCHDSRFAVNGDKQTGPSERGLDPLPIAVKDGRLQLMWVRYKNGSTTREPA